MLHDSRISRLWNILYPVVLYFLLSNTVIFLLNALWKQTDENYLIRYSIATMISLPVVFSFYRRQEQKKTGIGTFVLAAVCGMAFAVALNNLIAYSPLISHSVSYREISASLYGNTILLEIFATCLLAPLLEETLYRGVVYTRLREWFGTGPAMVLSALLFGLMHFNIVQLIYAGIFGLLLAFVMEKYGLRAAVLTHAAGNLICILRSETDLHLLLDRSGTVMLVETGLAVLLTGLSLWGLIHKKII